MGLSLVTREVLRTFLTRLDAAFERPGRVYLIGETSHVYEGWWPWTDCVEIAGRVEPRDQEAFEGALSAVREELGISVVDESPAEVIPLPSGYESRARPATSGTEWLEIFHFDPCSTAFRFLARGDESDYRIVLGYLEHGWLTVERMESALADVLPRFSTATIQQDPAEFRRRYKGLLQMWKVSTSRPTRGA